MKWLDNRYNQKIILSQLTLHPGMQKITLRTRPQQVWKFSDQFVGICPLILELKNKLGPGNFRDAVTVDWSLTGKNIIANSYNRNTTEQSAINWIESTVTSSWRFSNVARKSPLLVHGPWTVSSSSQARSRRIENQAS